MKRLVVFLLLCCILLPALLHAADAKPEMIAEKMSFKLVRGVTNVVTSPLEIPTQTILTVRRHGAVGAIVGPVKGVGMMLYRGVIGFAEAVFFLVPQPGYYEPMIDPPFVWDEWQNSPLPEPPADSSEVRPDVKGEKEE